MRLSLTTLLILGFANILFAQYNPEDDDEPKYKSYYKLSDFSLHYSGAIFDFNSSYLDHMHSIYAYKSPEWPNMDSTLKHSNRSEVYTRLNFSKQLFSTESSIYGNFSLGIAAGFGNRLDAAYKSEQISLYDSTYFNEDPVTNLDSTIILQREYQYSSTEIGFDIMYTVSSSPKPTLKGEIGVGLTGLYSISGNVLFTDSEAINISFTDQFNRIQSFNELNRDNSKIEAQPQLIMKLYLPVILSYKLSHHGNFALSTMFSGGIEFQKPKNGSFYSYPYFTIGIGCKYYF